jgi:hypothetical protein
MRVRPSDPERYPPKPPGDSGFPPAGGEPPPAGVTIPVRIAVIGALSLAAGAITAALYLNGPARVITAVSAAIVVCFTAARIFSRVIR